jgi:hypothetical protein
MARVTPEKIQKVKAKDLNTVSVPRTPIANETNIVQMSGAKAGESLSTIRVNIAPMRQAALTYSRSFKSLVIYLRPLYFYKFYWRAFLLRLVFI